MQLIQLSHLLFLEVLDLLLSLGELLVDGALLTLHTLLLVLEVTDVELDAILGIVEHETVVTKALDFVDLGVLAELWVEVVIVVIVILFLDFFLFGLLAIFVTLSIILLDLLRSATLLGDLLIEGQDLVVVLMVGIDQFVELGQQFGLFLFDVFNLCTLSDQFLGDLLDFFDNETLGLSASLELAREAEVFRLHRLEQD